MTETVGVTYIVYFFSVADADRARDRLDKAGFAVTAWERDAPTHAPHGLEATLSADSEATASVKLDEALADVPHDPIIHWQSTRFSGFVTPARREGSSASGDCANARADQ